MSQSIKYFYIKAKTKGSFQKETEKNIWKFQYVRGGSGGIIFHMFSATHQNASKAILSIFRHFFFPL